MKINKTKLHITIYVVAIIFLGFSFSRIFFKPAEKNSSSSAPLFASVINDPDGKPQNLKQFQHKTIVLNFWATWCPPCIEELPLIDAFYAANQAKSFQVVGLAVDQPSMVRRYLTQKPLRFPNGLAGFNGTALGQTLGNAQSVLPYSVLFAANGRLLKQKAGKLEKSDLDAWLQLVS